MFPIEQGRYENIERQNRTCKLCNQDIGDEEHYFMSCTHHAFTMLRAQFKNKLSTQQDRTEKAQSPHKTICPRQGLNKPNTNNLKTR